MSKSRHVSIPFIRGNRVTDRKRRKQVGTTPCPPVRGQIGPLCDPVNGFFRSLAPFPAKPAGSACPRRSRAPSRRNRQKPPARTLVSRFSKSAGERRGRIDLRRFRDNLCKWPKPPCKAGLKNLSNLSKPLRGQSTLSRSGGRHVGFPARFVKTEM